MKLSLRKPESLLWIYGILFAISLALMFGFWNIVSKVFSSLLGSPIMWAVYLGGVMVLFVLHRKNPSKFSVKELIISALMTFPTVFILFAVFFSTTTDLADTEYLNSYITKAVHIEDYYTERTETKCQTCTDSKGQSYECNCVTYTYCDVYHPDDYYAKNALGSTISLSSKEYANIAKQFGTQEVQVASSQPGQCSGDGDEFEVRWGKTIETSIPTSETHMYINYVKATHSLHRITGQKGNKDLIVPYPKLYDQGHGNVEIQRVLAAGITVPKQWQDHTDKLTDQALCTLGSKRQCNILYYFVHESESFYGFLEQEWIGGKKNDIIVVVGMKQWPQIEWVRVMCWSQQSLFAVQLRDKVRDMKNIPDPKTFVSTVTTQIDQPGEAGFQRQPMADYKYLLKEVNMSIWSIVAIILLAGLMLTPVIIFFLATDAVDRTRRFTSI